MSDTRQVLQEGDYSPQEDIKPSGFITFIKKIPLWAWIAIAVVFLIIFYTIFGKRFGFNIPPVPDFDPADYDLLNQDPLGPAILIGDTSPVFFESGGDLKEEDYIRLGSEITTKWADRMAVICNNFDSDLEPMGVGLAYIMASQPAVATERAIDVWLALVGHHCGLMKVAIEQTADAIAEIAVATLEGVESSRKCTKTTFTKVDKSKSSYTHDETTNIKEGSGGSSALWGLFSSGGSSKTATTTIHEITTENVDISYVPTCSEQNLDIAQLDAVLAVQNISTVAALANLGATAKLFPKASAFFKIPTK